MWRHISIIYKFLDAVLWGFKYIEVYPKYGCETGRTLSMQIASAYSQIAAKNGCYFLDAVLLAHTDEADGMHWSPVGHENYAKALAEKILNMR